LGNLLGDCGEFIATHQYGLEKAIVGADGYDARTHDGRTVQVKTNHSASQIGFRGDAELMLFLHVTIDGNCEEIYYGPFAPVKAASRYSARDNKQTISITKLRAMNAALHESGPDAAISVGLLLPDEGGSPRRLSRSVA
jgi:uncharacterized protein DUF6998